MENFINLKMNRAMYYKKTSVLKSLKYLFIISIALVMTECTSNNMSSADIIRHEASASNQNMYVIEREIPGAGKLTPSDLQEISKTSCGVLEEMGSEIQWLHSYVTGDKVYCVYTAPNEELVREHAKKGGFPANSVSKVTTVIDPTTAEK